MMNVLLNASKIGKMKIWDSFLIAAFDSFQNILELYRIVPSCRPKKRIFAA
jgi:hypothetical protein